MSTPETKRCSRCHEVRPAADYHRKAEANDGLASYCKPCSAESSRAWRAANRTHEGRPAKPEPQPKACVCCGIVFEMRPNEVRRDFEARSTCGRSCGSRLAAQRQRAQRSVASEVRRIEIGQHLMAHPDETNAQAGKALGACRDRVSAVRAELQRPPQALVPRWDITARHVAEYLQASEAVRRLFDPAIAEAAMRVGVVE